MTSFVTFSSGRRPAAQQQVAAHQRQEWQSQELWRQPLKGASHFPGRRSSSQTSPPPTLKWYFKEIFSRQENPSKTRFYLFVWLLLSKLLLVFVVVRRPRRRRRRCRFFDHCARMEKNVLLYIFVSADVCVATVVLVLVWLCQSMVCLVLEDFIFQG